MITIGEKFPTFEKKIKPKKPKVFKVKVGCYAYALRGEDVVEARIVKIETSHRFTDSCWVTFRDTGNNKLFSVKIYPSSICLSKKKAYTQLIKKLKKNLNSEVKALRIANKDYLRADKALNSALRTYARIKSR